MATQDEDPDIRFQLNFPNAIKWLDRLAKEGVIPPQLGKATGFLRKTLGKTIEIAIKDTEPKE